MRANKSKRVYTYNNKRWSGRIVVTVRWINNQAVSHLKKLFQIEAIVEGGRVILVKSSLHS